MITLLQLECKLYTTSRFLSKDYGKNAAIVEIRYDYDLPKMLDNFIVNRRVFFLLNCVCVLTLEISN